MAELILKPGKERSAMRRHPWIFAGAVEKSSRQGVDRRQAEGARGAVACRVAAHQFHRRAAGRGAGRPACVQRRQRAVEQREGQADAAVVELHGAELALPARLVGERRQDDALHARRPQRRIDALRGVDEPAANGSSAAHSLSACLWERPTGRDCAPQEVPLGCSRRYRGQ